MSSNQTRHMFVFAIVICITCSLLLTIAATALKDIQQENIRLDKQKHILRAMGLIPLESKSSKAEVKEIYTSNVKDMFVTPHGELTSNNTNKNNSPIYVYQNENGIQSYALPTAGYGLWSWLYGYIAIKGDGETIAGYSIYQHAETPGLGAEAEKPWFLNQFKGKRIVDNSGMFVSVGVIKGKVSEKIQQQKQDNYVDGISGATITSAGISKSLKENLSAYEPFSQKLREKEVEVEN